MRVGWAIADYSPGTQLGSDDCSWAFDGFNVSGSLLNIIYIIFGYKSW